MPAWQTTQAACVEQRCVGEEALDANVGCRREARRVDLGGRDHDLERLACERRGRDLGEPAVVLEEGRAGDEHERSVEAVQPGGGIGGRFPEAGADEA